MSYAKGWVFPVLLGLLVFILGWFPAYSRLVAVGCIIGYVLGYWDPWNAKGERR